ncbi:hypothetical protein NSA52_04610 [Clostridium sporogenes]|uniref:hypothetical protein n=1 Tax=Clostridium sporogenes TaxID=1509 RepID=UPI002149F42D|nr:hypothetical protein [Clostridium sporogenes]MCR1973413.1 hypothetical protein [Clostridium sporogenes]
MINIYELYKNERYSLGIDVGLKESAIMSDGKILNNLKWNVIKGTLTREVGITLIVWVNLYH